MNNSPLAWPAAWLCWGWALLVIFAVGIGGPLSGGEWAGLLAYALLPAAAATWFARRAKAADRQGEHRTAFRLGWIPPLILAVTVLLPILFPLEQMLRPWKG